MILKCLKKLKNPIVRILSVAICKNEKENSLLE